MNQSPITAQNMTGYYFHIEIYECIGFSLTEEIYE